MHSRTALAFLLVLSALPALSAETDWVELAPDVHMRLVSSNTVDENGLMWMGLEIDMPPDTKTYWRVPGESGIPLVLTDRASQGVGAMEIAWPFPQREADSGYLDHSFYGWTMIPIGARSEGDTGSVDIEAMLGICSDICVPATARFDLDFDLAAPDSSHAFRIRQALAEVPQADPAEGVIGEAHLDRDEKTVVVDWLGGEIDPSSVIAELDGTLTVFDVPTLASDGGTLIFPVLGRIPADMFENAHMRFSYDTGEGSFETTRPLILD